MKFRCCGAVLGILIVSPVLLAQGLDFENEPIRYSQARAENAVTRLQAQMEEGKRALPFHPRWGYLPALLEVWNIPISSQGLVFSHTSLQHNVIGPKTPRALYFNDDVYVGYVQDGRLELAAADPQLGMVFYTLDQTEKALPRFQRQTDSCLNCHASKRTRHVPGLQMRSVFPDPEGRPILALGSFRTEQSSPFGERWGGWYVTGKHGRQHHLGNRVVQGENPTLKVPDPAGQNLPRLNGFFDLDQYLCPHGDLVALLVLEHQIDAHNYLTRALYETRLALEAHGKPAAKLEELDQEGREKIQSAVEDLLQHFLFTRERKLEEPVEGPSTFAKDFTAHPNTPRDARGRSLRDLDLQTRLMKYPLSYMIHAPSFRNLPPLTRAEFFRRLDDVLTGKATGPGFPTPADRQNLRELLAEMKTRSVHD